MASQVVKAKKIEGPICKKIVVSSRNKSLNVGFCTKPCNHYSELREGRLCGCCGQVVVHKQNYTALKKRFDEIVEDNIFFIESNKSWPAKMENRFCVFTKIGLYHYKIDIRYFIEYMDLINIDYTPDAYERFFDEIKEHCPRVII